NCATALDVTVPGAGVLLRRLEFPNWCKTPQGSGLHPTEDVWLWLDLWAKRPWLPSVHEDECTLLSRRTCAAAPAPSQTWPRVGPCDTCRRLEFRRMPECFDRILMLTPTSPLSLCDGREASVFSCSPVRPR